MSTLARLPRVALVMGGGGLIAFLFTYWLGGWGVIIALPLAFAWGVFCGWRGWISNTRWGFR